MKTTFFILISLVLFVSAFTPTHADLIKIDQYTVLDSSTKRYWYADLGYFSSAMFCEQQAAIDSLNNNPGTRPPGQNLWKMSSVEAMDELWDYSAIDIIAVFEPSAFDITLDELGFFGLDGVEHVNMWYGQYDEIHPGAMDHLGTGIMQINGIYKKGSLTSVDPGGAYSSDWLGAWVATAAPTHSVPEPTVAILFASVLVFLLKGQKRLKE